MNGHWYNDRCRYGCGAWVWQYEPGGRYWEREPGQKEKPHTCPRPTVQKGHTRHGS